ncbi:MAG: hypothetical protein SVY10_05775 [Thermodesulfobacteriota bacterium]|nr:hypothetical protein [Thermodesulfobacteriota bacterium]
MYFICFISPLPGSHRKHNINGKHPIVGARCFVPLFGSLPYRSIPSFSLTPVCVHHTCRFTHKPLTDLCDRLIVKIELGLGLLGCSGLEDMGCEVDGTTEGHVQRAPTFVHSSEIQRFLIHIVFCYNYHIITPIQKNSMTIVHVFRITPIA